MLYRAFAVVVLAVCSLAYAADKPDYLALVRAYADAMIEKGRDRYGPVHSPLFAVALDRQTLSLRYELASAPSEAARQRARELAAKSELQIGEFGPIPGFREHDRTINGANPQRDVDLYQVLYGLTQLTGEARYATEADAAIKWFFENTRSKATDLLAWGDHIGWDFVAEAPSDRDRYRGTFIHEYSYEWLWEPTYRVAPQAALAFARGLWNHQIADHTTGNFSRHARYNRHEPFKDSQFPAHGARYISAWAVAYEYSKDELFLRAIETLTNHFETRRRPEDGVIPARDEDWSPTQRGRDTVWANQNLTLVVRWWEAAQRVPEPLASRLRSAAEREEEALLKHYADGLGQTGAAYARYRQTQRQEFRDLVIKAAEEFDRDSLMVTVGYRDPKQPTVISKGMAVPRDFASAIWLQLRAYSLTGEQRFLDTADSIARQAVQLFLRDGSPLPAATNLHDHYEAITGGPSLMLALLNLWQVQNRPESPLQIVHRLQ